MEVRFSTMQLENNIYHSMCSTFKTQVLEFTAKCLYTACTSIMWHISKRHQKWSGGFIYGSEHILNLNYLSVHTTFCKCGNCTFTALERSSWREIKNYICIFQIWNIFMRDNNAGTCLWIYLGSIKCTPSSFWPEPDAEPIGQCYILCYAAY